MSAPWNFNQHLNDQGGQNLAAYAIEFRHLFWHISPEEVDVFMNTWREAMINFGLTEEEITEVLRVA